MLTCYVARLTLRPRARGRNPAPGAPVLRSPAGIHAHRSGSDSSAWNRRKFAR
ncbi:hypothetical protein GA0115243_1115296 [Streptomyces sp. ScaeMP-e83]|nr:hypothetical protein GA0115243_1115296 [Streptomyces sp. ScaeMP-e83]